MANHLELGRVILTWQFKPIVQLVSHSNCTQSFQAAPSSEDGAQQRADGMSDSGCGRARKPSKKGEALQEDIARKAAARAAKPPAPRSGRPPGIAGSNQHTKRRAKRQQAKRAGQAGVEAKMLQRWQQSAEGKVQMVQMMQLAKVASQRQAQQEHEAVVHGDGDITAGEPTPVPSELAKPCLP